jgi:hypothetical protein
MLWLIVANRTAAGPYALALSFTGFILTGIMLITRRQAYIRFRPDESLAAHLPPDVVPIQADEKIPIQATGMLRVRNSRRYREHIAMARIPVSRMWLVAKSSQEEEGWWYAFVKPAHIRGIQTGWLYHGLRLRPALTLYLSAADPLTIHRLLEDLVRDAGRPVEHQQYVPL